MERLGIKEYQNPLIIASPVGYMTIQFVNASYNAIESAKNKLEEKPKEEQITMKNMIDRGNEFINNNS